MADILPFDRQTIHKGRIPEYLTISFIRYGLQFYPSLFDASVYFYISPRQGWEKRQWFFYFSSGCTRCWHIAPLRGSRYLPQCEKPLRVKTFFRTAQCAQLQNAGQKVTILIKCRSMLWQSGILDQCPKGASYTSIVYCPMYGWTESQPKIVAL